MVVDEVGSGVGAMVRRSGRGEVARRRDEEDSGGAGAGTAGAGAGTARLGIGTARNRDG